MPDDDFPNEESQPIETYEQMLETKRNNSIQSIKLLSYWFFGLHGYAVFVLCAGLAGFEIVWVLASTLMLAWFISTILAISQGAITLKNSSVLRWWMIAVRILPWMVIATEVVVVLLMDRLG